MHHQGYRTPLLGGLLILAAASLWGTIGLTGRSLYDGGLTPGAVVTLRAGGAALLLLAVLGGSRPGLLRIQVKDLPFFAIYGLVSVAAFYLLYFSALQLIPVAAASVLLYTAPAFVAAVAWLTLGEPLTRLKLSALGVTLIGCFLVAGAYKPAVFQGQVTGLLAGLGAGLTYGLYSIFGKYGLKRYNPWTVQVYSLVAGSLPLLLIYGREAASVMTAPSLWPTVAYLCLVTTLVPYSLYLIGLQYVEAGYASILATIEPVVAALVGYWFLREPLALPQVAGILLVLVSAILLNLGSKGAAGLYAESGAPGNKKKGQPPIGGGRGEDSHCG